MWDSILPAGGKEIGSYNIILQSYLIRNSCSYIMRTKVWELLFLSYNKGWKKSRGGFEHYFKNHIKTKKMGTFCIDYP